MEIFPCHREFGEVLLSVLNKEEQSEFIRGSHVSATPLSVGGESKKFWRHSYQWRSQPWNMPVPAALGSNSDSATPVL